ncbi:TolC family protein [Robiginitalea sp. M366]|uniref:TolC family protein n=1 Tax=Robiginitalea aestuariiviva TaxID=3036903 RepID=UPI00240D050E|nr:TolC family protein [Robiginitalea aestuariiviva]MDG1573354.1 TolC family protein [Robiginitalea aestuariiviva]
MMRTRHITSLLLLASLAVQAQEVAISEAEIMQRALKANTQLKISEAAYREARGAYRQTQAIFLPSLSASHTGIVTTNPLMAFGSRLNQEVLTAADFNPELLNDPERTENYATRLEVQQPLLNVDGLYQRKAARYQMEATALQGERSRQYLELEIRRAYMELQLAHKSVTVLEKALQAAQSYETLAGNLYQKGYLQKSDLLAVQVRVSEVLNHLHQARSQVANTSDYLSLLMDTTPSVIYIPRDSLKPAPQAAPLAPELPSDRADLKALSLATEAYKNAYKAEQTGFLPRLNAFGTYELYDDQLFRFGASGYTLGAQLSWDLFKGNSRTGRIQASKAAYDKSRLEQQQYQSQSQMEWQKAQRALADARSRLQGVTLSLEQAREALRIRSNRFREGLEKTTDLLSAEASAAHKELEYAQTVYAVNYALAYLEFLAPGQTPQTQHLNK